MKWFKLTPYVIIIILAIILFFKGCGKETEVITVTVPAVSGSFDFTNPTYVPQPKPVILELQGKKVQVDNPVNDTLLKAFQNAQHENDSLKQLLMFVDAIQIREFSNDFDDENIELNISGKVQGHLLGIKPTYAIKERTTEVELKKTSLRILGGFEVGSNENINDFPLKLNLGLQNAKGNILRASFMKLNGQNYYLGGYDFSILNIKK